MVLKSLQVLLEGQNRQASDEMANNLQFQIEMLAQQQYNEYWGEDE